MRTFEIKKLVTALPGQGYRRWWYWPEDDTLTSEPVLGWAVYRRTRAGLHDNENCCEHYAPNMDEDDCEVNMLVAGGNGDVEEVIDNDYDYLHMVGVTGPGDAAINIESARSTYRARKEIRENREKKLAEEAALK